MIKKKSKVSFMKRLGFAFLAVIMLSGTFGAGVQAADTKIKYQIMFQLDDGEKVPYKEGEGNVGDEINVRNTYYNKDTGKDYDLAGDNSQTVVAGQTEYVFQYKSYEAPSIKGSVSMVTSDGTILQQEILSIESKGSTEYDVPETITAKNGKVYAKQAGQSDKITVTYNSTIVDFTILYKEVTNFEPYTVDVQYLDEDGRPLQTAAFTVTGVDYIYYAPLTLKVSSGGDITYYNIADTADAKITHDADSTKREYNISYKKFDGQSSYTWYIYRYDGYTNQRLGTPVEIQVPVGETVTYKPEASVSSSGTTYNLDPGMEKEYSHKYGDSDRISYVYYNPEGYVPEGNYTLTVEYRNIANNNVFYSTTITARPGADTDISTPADYQANGIQYVRLDGQRDTITHSYYSPKRVYTIYYRDINDTEYENTVITRVETITTLETIDDGTTDGGTTGGGTAGATAGGAAAAAGAGDGTATVGVVDETTGENQTQAVEEADGSLVEAPDEDVPLANVQKDAKDQNNIRFWLLGVIALLMVIGTAVFIMKKKREAKVNEVE